MESFGKLTTRTTRLEAPAILRAYDALNVITELYEKAESGSRDIAGQALKFTVPTIADRKVFVGTSNELDIYDLLGQ